MILFTRRKGLVWFAWMTILLVLLAAPAYADSLYTDSPTDDQHNAGLYAKHPIALAVGDIVKVQIREQSTADVELGVQTKDEFKSDTKLERTGGLLGRILQPAFKLLGAGDFGFDTSTDFKDDGKTDRSVRLDALVTALVVDVLDNGYVIIEGRKRVLVNKEEQTMLVRGLIDPRDLDSDRVIDSDQVADVEIEYLGDGQLSKRTKPGFLSRVIDFIF